MLGSNQTLKNPFAQVQVNYLIALLIPGLPYPVKGIIKRKRNSQTSDYLANLFTFFAGDTPN